MAYLVFKRDMPAGHWLTEDDVEKTSGRVPKHGINANRLAVVGYRLVEDVVAGQAVCGTVETTVLPQHGRVSGIVGLL